MKREPGRRAFLRGLGGAVAAALVGEWWWRRRGEETPAIRPLAVPGAADLAVGAAAVFTAGGVNGLLVRTGHASYAAFDRRCPHLGCPVLWEQGGQTFACPCHAAAFDAEGKVLSGPPRRGLTRLSVMIRDDEVWVGPPMIARKIS